MDSADRVESRAGQEERGEGSEGMQGRLEDLEIRLSGKYNGFDLAEAFDPRTDRTTLKTGLQPPNRVARPSSIDSALFLCRFLGKN